MPHDGKLASRIRDLLVGEEGVTETKMFGGLAFMVGGNMAVAASGQGGILVRIDPDDAEKLVARSGVAPMVMRGKEMKGWLRVEADAIKTKRQLTSWVERGMAQARRLPIRRGHKGTSRW
jgi:TfoX/Sxy family transcriptional regulator of competence genes